MEKRFVVFILLTAVVLTTHILLQAWLAPPQPVVDPAAEQLSPETPSASEPADLAAGTLDSDESDQADAEQTDAGQTDAGQATTEQPAISADGVGDTAADEYPSRKFALGSYQGTAAVPFLVTLDSLGATVERIELTERDAQGRLRYRDLEDRSGYVGHLGLTAEANLGCRVGVVGAETPAALAGIAVGDVITAVSGAAEMPIRAPADLDQFLAGTKPGETITVTIENGSDSQTASRQVDVQLGVRPFQIIRPEPLEPGETVPHRNSLLFSLRQVAHLEVAPGEPELAGLPSARLNHWQLEPLESGDGVECRFRWTKAALAKLGADGPIELIKRIRLAPGSEEQPGYHLQVEVEVRNLSAQPQQIAYHLDGPAGLPLEGWWYLNKIHPKMFQAAGARDVIIRTDGDQQRLYGCSAIYDRAVKRTDSPTTVLFAADDPTPNRTVRYLGVDTQYFLGALLPEGSGTFLRGEAVALGDLASKSKARRRTTNVSFQLESAPLSMAAGASHTQRFRFFVGPKAVELLQQYELQDTIYYGWFGGVARPLAGVLHFFYRLVGNYGIAIVLLTILVRSMMFPLSRKAAKNAAMMQELAPEMKKITEKYKNDMEKRAKAQQELFRKHNYNPVGGCWVMFLQLPIFIGLYRCLAVDIELRQAALIPGLEWCSNLAGPDMLFYWGNLGFGLFSETGFLGPYFNIFPIFTIILFLVHQQLFTPPATDEQTRIQLKMMKFMTIFIGVMFFKVASGLCLYFIASSLWGIAERKLVPPPKAGGAAAKDPKPTRPTGSNGNSSQESPKKRRKPKRR